MRYPPLQPASGGYIRLLLVNVLAACALSGEALGVYQEKRMRWAILVAANVALVYLLFLARLERSSFSIGPFSFSILHETREEPLSRAIAYIESYEVEPAKNRSVLVALERLYFEEMANRTVWRRPFESLWATWTGASRQQQLRRLLASLYAKKMGLLSAAEAEIRTNLQERQTCADLIFLGEILSLRTPDENAQIIEQFRTAIAQPDCKPGSANYEKARNNIALREGHILFNQGKFEEAASRYSEVIRYNPRSFAAHNSLANSRANIGDLAGAIASYDKAITYATTNADASLATFLKATVLLSVAELPATTPEATRAALGEAIKSADLSIQLVEHEYAQFPLGSFQRHSLADKQLLRGRLYRRLGDLKGAAADFESCLNNAVEQGLRSQCEQQLEQIKDSAPDKPVQPASGGES